MFSDLRNRFLEKFPDLDVRALQAYLDFLEQAESPGKGDWHHILPRSLFPELKSRHEHPGNQKLLRYRDHFTAHYLLYKLLPSNRGVVYALKCMAVMKRALPDFPQDLALSYAEVYEEARIKCNGYASERQLGKKHSEETKRRLAEVCKPPSQKGRKRTEENKQEMSERLRGNTKRRGSEHTEETKRKQSEVKCGKVQSEETKQKRAESMRTSPRVAEARERKPSQKGRPGIPWTPEKRARIAETKRKTREARLADSSL